MSLTVQNYGLIDNAQVSFAQLDAETQKSSVEMRGYLNIGEKRFENGTLKFEYHLFVGDHRDNPPYSLNFEDIPDDIYDLSGNQVVVYGDMNHHTNNQALFFSDSYVIDVNSVRLSDPVQLQSSSSEPSKLLDETKRSVPSNLKSIVILSQFSDVSSKPHNKAYFQDRWFNDTDSLKYYWEDMSYGAITMSAGTTDGTGVVDWQSLPSSSSEYSTYDEFAMRDILTTDDIRALLGDSIRLADPFVDFNGADDIIQNTGFQIGGPGNNGDDVDQIIMVFNDSFVDGLYAFAYLSPVPIYTDEGDLFVYTTWAPDTGDGFAVGVNYENGVGVIAHEMGHNFGWTHTPPPTGTNVYADPWSIMSGGPFDGPAGAIAFNRDQAGWIPSADIRTVPSGTCETLTLDVLSDPSPGADYLMGKIPFGHNGEYYTLEARVDSIFDQTPSNQFGLMIYHYNPNGHTGSPEPSSAVNVVDTTGSSDFSNADLDIGNSYSANDVLIEYLSDTETSITVRVRSNVSQCSSFSVSSQDNSPTDLVFSNDGAKMFVVGDQNDRVYQYALSEPFDLFTTVYSLNVTLHDSTPTGIAFSANGTEMFVVGDQNDRVYQYALSEPFDLSTSVYSLNMTIHDSSPQGLTFSADGTEMFVVGDQNDRVYQYALSEPFDLSTSVYSLNVTLHDSTPTGIAFSANGTEMFVVGDQNDRVYVYMLSIPFNVTSSVFASSFDVSSQDTIPQGVTFSSNGTEMFVIGDQNDRVYLYALPVPFDPDMTLPTFTARSDSFTQTSVTFSEEINGMLRFSEWSFDGNVATAVAGYADNDVLSGVTGMTFTHNTTDEQTPIISYTGTSLADNSLNGMATGAVVASDGAIPTFTARSDSFTQTSVTFSEEINGMLRFSEWSFDGNVATAVAGYADNDVLSGITVMTFTHNTTDEQTPVVSYNGSSLADDSLNGMATGAVVASDGVIPTFTARSDSFTQTSVTFSEEINGMLRFSEWSFDGNVATAVAGYADNDVLSGVTVMAFTHNTTDGQTPVVSYNGSSLADDSLNGMDIGAVVASDGVIPTFTARSDSFTQTSVTFSEEINGMLRFSEWSFDGNVATAVAGYADNDVLSGITVMTFTHNTTDGQTPVVSYNGSSLADDSLNGMATGAVVASDGVIPTFTARSDSFTQTSVTFSEEINGMLRFSEWSFDGNVATAVAGYADNDVLSGVTVMAFTHNTTDGQTPVVSYNGSSLADDSLNGMDIAFVIASDGIPLILCTVPDSGDWIITDSCMLSADYAAIADVLVQDNSVLVISSGVILDIDFVGNNLTIESGSGVLIKSGGTIT